MIKGEERVDGVNMQIWKRDTGPEELIAGLDPLGPKRNAELTILSEERELRRKGRKGWM